MGHYLLKNRLSVEPAAFRNRMVRLRKLESRFRNSLHISLRCRAVQQPRFALRFLKGALPMDRADDISMITRSQPHRPGTPCQDIRFLRKNIPHLGCLSMNSAYRRTFHHPVTNYGIEKIAVTLNRCKTYFCHPDFFNQRPGPPHFPATSLRN